VPPSCSSAPPFGPILPPAPAASRPNGRPSRPQRRRPAASRRRPRRRVARQGTCHSCGGGRFKGKTDPVMEMSNASIHFDKWLCFVDREGSRCYARALTRTGLIQEAPGGRAEGSAGWAGPGLERRGGTNRLRRRGHPHCERAPVANDIAARTSRPRKRC
jgi:hypothetical protein